MLISGTIRSSVKLAELDAKWQQKKGGGKALQKEIDPQIRQIMQYKEDLEKMRESSKMSSVNNKVLSGGMLTSDEVEYLKKNNPELYREYAEIENERKAYKEQLKSCKTKEDVERLKINKMNGYLAEAKSISGNANIPKGRKLQLLENILKKMMGIQSEHMEFVKSGQYKDLPTDKELADEAGESTEELRETTGGGEADTDKEPIQEESGNAGTENTDGTGKEAGIRAEVTDSHSEPLETGKKSSVKRKNSSAGLPALQSRSAELTNELKMILKRV